MEEAISELSAMLHSTEFEAELVSRPGYVVSVCCLKS